MNSDHSKRIRSIFLCHNSSHMPRRLFASSLQRSLRRRSYVERVTGQRYVYQPFRPTGPFSLSRSVALTPLPSRPGIYFSPKSEPITSPLHVQLGRVRSGPTSPSCTYTTGATCAPVPPLFCHYRFRVPLFRIAVPFFCLAALDPRDN